MHYHFNRVFLSLLEHRPQYFHDGLEIASFYGTFPQSLWNGGRLISSRFDKKTAKIIVEQFDKLGIPLRFTFTNPTLVEEDLKDDFCNYILKIAENGKNGVIVVSPLLEDYIRSRYPGYKITSSTCKRITDIDKLNEELDRSYDIVVIDYDFNNNFELLEKINNKEKCEILVNACCRPNCPNRSNHYRDMGSVQKALCQYVASRSKVPFDKKRYKVSDENSENCPYMTYDAVDVRQHSTHISPEDIFEKYIPMGFNQFKIEGRTAGVFNLVEYYVYYMVKPEYRDKARLEFYALLAAKNIISDNTLT